MTDREEQVVIHASNRKLPCHSLDACAFQKTTPYLPFKSAVVHRKEKAMNLKKLESEVHF